MEYSELTKSGGKIMSEAVQWVQLFAPAVTVALAIFALRVWYLQMLVKRRFEVAEQALICFARASDALRAIRSPMGYTSEQAAVQVADGMDPEQEALVRKWGVFRLRAINHADEYKDVRLNQILCELHISSVAAKAMGELFRIRHHVILSADMLAMGLVREASFVRKERPEQYAEAVERDRKYEADVWEMRDPRGLPMDRDQLSRDLDKAKADIERECRPLLRVQSFREFIGTGKKAPRAVDHK